MATAAFDVVAAGYDAEFTDTLLARQLRARVWRHLGACFSPGHRVVELGCGTGEDAAWLASRGVAVLATDVSEGMLATARRKAASTPLLSFARLDASALSLAETFDGAYANFGVLNCVPDLRDFGSRLAHALRPKAALIAVIMPPLCLWETAWYALHADFSRATRRWHGTTTADIGGTPLLVHYPSAARLARELAPGFSLRHVEGLGTLLPPSYLSHLLPRLPRWCQALDGKLPLGHLYADHYIAVLERQ